MRATQRAAPARDEDLGAIDRLNAVTISGQQLKAALEILAALPAHLRQGPHAQALALQAYASEAGFEDDASAALHARVAALAKWTAAHDLERQFDAQSVLEATARFPLSGTETGLGLEPSGFQELILFIDDLPW